MKKLIQLSIFFLFCQAAFSQETIQTIVPVGDLFEVTIYYPNGKIMQHGFLSEDKKLHGQWESYFDDGKRKCAATYDNGNKVGVWYYWLDNKKTKVTYVENKIVDVEEITEFKEPKPEVKDNF